MRSHDCYQMVFSSSCTVYGEPEYLPITESHPTGSITNVYGRTKYFIEEMLKDLSAADKVTHLFLDENPKITRISDVQKEMNNG